MNIYKISQTQNDDYNTYDSAIVIANDGAEAATINPCPCGWNTGVYGWCESPTDVTVEELGSYTGTQVIPGIILSSFYAG